MITETNIEILKSRISKGIVYCNDIVQQAKTVENAEWKVLFDKMDKHVLTLNELADMLALQGYQECVFGTCKQSDNFVCLVCTK